MLDDTSLYGGAYLGDATDRRLSDLIARAFFRAWNAGDSVTAAHLLSALESLTERERALYPVDRRRGHNRLQDVRFIITPTDVTRD